MKLRLAIAALTLTLWSAPAWAQCSMCASSAQAANQQGQKALQRGITVLMLPTLGIMVALVGVAYRFRNGRPEDQ
jgi:heme/copper-type cytochrome/quinol oxidase subunit 2